MKSKKIYIKEAADILGKHPDTLRRWDREGTLVAKREKQAHQGRLYRYYTEDQLFKFMKTHGRVH